MSVRVLTLCCLLTAQCFLPAAAEGVVYTWVDEEGITHFSDTPPGKAANAAGDVEAMAMPAGFPDVPDAADDYYSITNQWQRLQDERESRQAMALERDRLRVEQIRASRQVARAAANETNTEKPTVIYGGERYYPGLSGFIRSHHGPAGHHAWKRKFADKRARGGPLPGGRRGMSFRQQHVGNHERTDGPRGGDSRAASQRLGYPR